MVHRPLPKDDPTRRRPDTTRASTRLGWKPVVPFEQGVAATVAWFKALADEAGQQAR